MIYLDNAATTKLKATALSAMMPFLTDEYGNPSAIHMQGGKARRAVETAREEIAALVNAERDEIVFTSGGSESDTLAIAGFMKDKPKGSHIITSGIEHPAVLNVCREMENNRFSVTYLKPNVNGIINTDDIKRSIRPETVLISIMAANNETGAIQRIKEAGFIAHENSIAFHTDAVQAFGHIPLDVKDMHIDMMSVSGHKFGGPKGSGFLFVKRGAGISPVVFGGGQERGLRSGTENVPGIVGLASAAKECHGEMPNVSKRVTALKKLLCDMTLREIEDVKINGDINNSLPGTCNFLIPGCRGESIVIRLSSRDICISSASACASGHDAPSHVLKAMGLSDEDAVSSVRFSIGENNTEEEIIKAFRELKDVVSDLREIRGYIPTNTR